MHRYLAIFALSILTNAQPQVANLHGQRGVDQVLQQHLRLAEKARQKNDTIEQLRQLQPAFERAIQVQSVEWIGEIAAMIERAYHDIDQRSKGLAVMTRAAEVIRTIAGSESIRAAEFEFEVAMTYADLGRYADAKATMTQALRKVRKAAGPNSAL